MRKLLDFSWRFHKGHVPGAQSSEFDDKAWRRVDLPHDWSIEGPFDPADPGGASNGYLPGGIGWYRKRFRLPRACAGRKVFVEFEGAYQQATVWINGRRLGRHAYGYTGFYFDLTPHVTFGRDANLLAVKVDNTDRPNTRWYSGSGIYRHVWLIVTDPVHVAHWGTYVTTPSVTKASAQVRVVTTVLNESAESRAIDLATRILAPDGRAVAAARSAATIAPGGSCDVTQTLRVRAPALWSVRSPAMHTVQTQVEADGSVTDRHATPFGIRSFRFDPNKGFSLNGERMKLRGVNLHHDNGCLGAAAPDRAEERRVELMKSIGANAIRTSHNPPSPAFLDACDRLGVLVLDEAFDEWRKGKLRGGTAGGYHRFFDACWKDDLRAMIRRDRNHPCVILWSIGNEIVEQAEPQAIDTARMLAGFVRAEDPTRPVTYGTIKSPWPSSRFFDALDVCGYNYCDERYVPDHERYPKRTILQTESWSTKAFRDWMGVAANEHVSGHFIWTGMDYIGEAGIGHVYHDQNRFPVNLAMCGELDLCGFKKPRSYYRDILWQDGTRLHMTVHRPLPEGRCLEINRWGWPPSAASWTWPGLEGELLDVDVYSACEEVALYLNGRLIGTNRTSEKTQFRAAWRIPYEPGTLKAVGRIRGRKSDECVLATVGEPKAIRLTPDRRRIRADGRDLSFVTVEIVDGRGMRHPNADQEIRFRVKGPGSIAGVGNGNPESIEPFQGRKRRAFNGRCLVVIRSGRKPGTIRLTAAGTGLREGSAILRSGR